MIGSVNELRKVSECHHAVGVLNENNQLVCAVCKQPCGFVDYLVEESSKSD